ncbi:MAG: hypothetical protein Ta2D_01290 [Rickettsiales bacterium]|nr:MAG: hypothetical protein Ta2D_01290 [Rickettsiales bacterium]
MLDSNYILNRIKKLLIIAAICLIVASIFIYYFFFRVENFAEYKVNDFKTYYNLKKFSDGSMIFEKMIYKDNGIILAEGINGNVQSNGEMFYQDYKYYLRENDESSAYFAHNLKIYSDGTIGARVFVIPEKEECVGTGIARVCIQEPSQTLYNTAIINEDFILY